MNMMILGIPFFTSRGVEYIPVNNIIRCRAISNYTCFYTKEKKMITAKCLGVFEEQLAQFGFVRPNRSDLLNINFIKSIRQNNTIELQDGSMLRISRRRRKDFSSLTV